MLKKRKSLPHLPVAPPNLEVKKFEQHIPTVFNFQCSESCRSIPDLHQLLLSGKVPIEVWDEPPQIMFHGKGEMVIHFLQGKEKVDNLSPEELAQRPFVHYKLYKTRLGRYVWGLSSIGL
jgi:hypothetical protein